MEMTQTDIIKNFEKQLEDVKQLFHKQSEREKTMTQPGSVAQLNQAASKNLGEINSLINNYNDEAAVILTRKDRGEFKNYTPEYVQELVKKETEGHLAKFQSLAEPFLKDSLEWLSVALRKKENLRFPLRSSVGDLQKAQLGEMKSLRAQSFVNSTKNPNMILNELFTALRSNDDDYFNSLVNYVLMDEPETEIEKSDLLSTQPERVKLFADVRKLYKDFSAKNELDLLDVAIQTLLVISTEATQFLAAIKGGQMYFVPQRMAKKMNQDEVARNIEAVNGSMPYWETKLENLNFVHQIV